MQPCRNAHTQRLNFEARSDTERTGTTHGTIAITRKPHNHATNFDVRINISVHMVASTLVTKLHCSSKPVSCICFSEGASRQTQKGLQCWHVFTASFSLQVACPGRHRFGHSGGLVNGITEPCWGALIERHVSSALGTVLSTVHPFQLQLLLLQMKTCLDPCHGRGCFRRHPRDIDGNGRRGALLFGNFSSSLSDVSGLSPSCSLVWARVQPAT